MITWFDVIVYAIGWVVLIRLAWAIGKAITRIAIAVGRASSVCRWTKAIIRTHGLEGRAGLSWIPLFFWTFVGGLSDSPDRLTHKHGIWSGIGEWTVFPPKEAA